MNTNNKIFKTDNKYQVLFEPIKIGPVIAKNRFYQVPHCNGGGYRDPSAAAEMRNIKVKEVGELFLLNRLKCIILVK